MSVCNMRLLKPCLAFIFLCSLIPGYADIGECAYYGVTLSGAQRESARYYPQNEQIAYFAQKGFRVIRIPFRWEYMQPTTNGALSVSDSAEIDRIISTASMYDLKVILVMHNNGRRAEAIIGSALADTNAYKDFWKRFAHRYRKSETVYGYGIMNMTYSTGAYPWFDTAQAGIDAIREVDMRHAIFVSGDEYGWAHEWGTANSNLAALYDPANALIFEARSYWDRYYSGAYAETYQAQGATAMRGVDCLRPFVEWLSLNEKKGFIGEYGIPWRATDVEEWKTVLHTALSYLYDNEVGAAGWGGFLFESDMEALSFSPNDYAAPVDKPQMSVMSLFSSAMYSDITNAKPVLSELSFAPLPVYVGTAVECSVVYADSEGDRPNAYGVQLVFDSEDAFPNRIAMTNALEGDYTTGVRYACSVTFASAGAFSCYAETVGEGASGSVRFHITNGMVLEALLPRLESVSARLLTFGDARYAALSFSVSQAPSPIVSVSIDWRFDARASWNAMPSALLHTVSGFLGNGAYTVYIPSEYFDEGETIYFRLTAEANSAVVSEATASVFVERLQQPVSAQPARIARGDAIEFIFSSLPASSRVSIHAVSGACVTTLRVEEENGARCARWRGKDVRNRNAPSGTYIAVVRAPGYRKEYLLVIVR